MAEKFAAVQADKSDSDTADSGIATDADRFSSCCVWGVFVCCRPPAGC